eukprot:275511-Amphidinium_carterae.1
MQALVPAVVAGGRDRHLAITVKDLVAEKRFSSCLHEAWVCVGIPTLVIYFHCKPLQGVRE